MNRFVAYYRVSTARQGQSGLGLDAQREAVMRHVRGGELVAEFTEIESGKRSDRPQIAAALAACRAHRATLVIAKLDRLARSVHFIAGLMESGVDFVAVDMPLANRLTVHILAAVAEHEAAMISARTKAALAAARARGVALGGARRPLTPEAAQRGRRLGAAARASEAARRAADLDGMVREIRSEGHVSLRAIAAQLSVRGVPTPTGRAVWRPAQVSRLIGRLAR